MLFVTVVISIIQQLYYYPKLPYKVAIHFNANGIPDNFSDKLFSALLQVGIIVFMTIVIFVADYFVKHGSDDFINIPNRKYWLAPERRKRTIDLLSTFVYWLGILTNVFLLFASQLLIYVNLKPTVSIGHNFWEYLTVYLLAIFISIWVFFRILNSKKKDKSNSES